MNHPLDPVRARTLIRNCVKAGPVAFQVHALKQMKARRMEPFDVMNVLRCGLVQPPDFVDGTWRYRVATMKMVVVVEFDDEDVMSIKTGWRL